MCSCVCLQLISLLFFFFPPYLPFLFSGHVRHALGLPVQNEVFAGDGSSGAEMVLCLMQSPHGDIVGGARGRPWFLQPLSAHRLGALHRAHSFPVAAVDSGAQHAPLLAGACLHAGSLVGPGYGFVLCSNPDSRLCLHLEDGLVTSICILHLSLACLEQRIDIKVRLYFATSTGPQT